MPHPRIMPKFDPSPRIIPLGYYSSKYGIWNCDIYIDVNNITIFDMICLNPGIILWIVDMTLINVYYLPKAFPTRSADF